jgi:hypothetical protein
MKLPKNLNLRQNWVESQIVPLLRSQDVVHPIVVTTLRMSFDEWDTKGRPIQLHVPTLVSHSNIHAMYDIGFGKLLVYDSRRGKVLYGRDPITYNDFVILGSFHGYDDVPVIFKRVS